MAAKKGTLKVPTYDELPDLITVHEAAAATRTSKNAIYAAIRAGHLPHVRFGRLIRIRKSVLFGEHETPAAAGSGR